MVARLSPRAMGQGWRLFRKDRGKGGGKVLPLHVERDADIAGGVEGHQHGLLAPRTDGGGKAVNLGLGQLLGRDEFRVEGGGDVVAVAQPRALGPGGAGVERVEGGVDGVKALVVDQAVEEAAFLPRGNRAADFVFGDHGGHGGGQAFGIVQDGGDGVAAKRAEGGKAAVAGDEAVGERVVFGRVDAEDLDRGVEAEGFDGADEVVLICL